MGKKMSLQESQLARESKYRNCWPNPTDFPHEPKRVHPLEGKITRTRKKKEKQNKEKLEAFVARLQWVKNSRFFQEKEERERDRERGREAAGERAEINASRFTGWGDGFLWGERDQRFSGLSFVLSINLSHSLLFLSLSLSLSLSFLPSFRSAPARSPAAPLD